MARAEVRQSESLVQLISPGLDLVKGDEQELVVVSLVKPKVLAHARPPQQTTRRGESSHHQDAHGKQQRQSQGSGKGASRHSK